MTDDELRLRVGVSDLLTTYQYLADTGRVQDVAGLFAPDGVMQIGENQYTGPDGWRFGHRRVITEGFAPDSPLA